MSDMTVAAVRQTVFEALSAQIPEKFIETWMGPRSTEIGFRTADGNVGSLFVSVKEMV